MSDEDYDDDAPLDDGEFLDGEKPKSKSQLKREATALQELGTALVQLKAGQLEKIPLDETLHAAIRAAQGMKRGALKRQLQYIGRLMRDAEVEPIRHAYDTLMGINEENNLHFHRLERWRERLVDEGDAALAELLDEHPAADRQHLRQLIRNAQKERDTGKPAGAGRALFRHLRELTEE